MGWSHVFPSLTRLLLFSPCLRLSWKCQAVIAHCWEQGDCMLWLLNSKSHSLYFVCLPAFFSPSPSLVKSKGGTCFFSWIFWMTAPPRGYSVNCCSGSGSWAGGRSGFLWLIQGRLQGERSVGHLRFSNMPHGRSSPEFECLSFGRSLQPGSSCMSKWKVARFTPFPPMSGSSAPTHELCERGHQQEDEESCGKEIVTELL